MVCLRDWDGFEFGSKKSLQQKRMNLQTNSNNLIFFVGKQRGLSSKEEKTKQ